MGNREDKERIYYEVPAGLIDLPTAAARHGVTRNSLHKRLQTGSLKSYGRLRGNSPGGGSVLLSERELLQIADSIAANKHHVGRPQNVPIHVDTGCNLSPSCLDCHLPRCQYDMTSRELETVKQRLWSLAHGEVIDRHLRAQAAQIVDLYRRGWSQRRIAKALHLNEGTVSKRIRETM